MKIANSYPRSGSSEIVSFVAGFVSVPRRKASTWSIVSLRGRDLYGSWWRYARAVASHDVTSRRYFGSRASKPLYICRWTRSLHCVSSRNNFFPRLNLNLCIDFSGTYSRDFWQVVGWNSITSSRVVSVQRRENSRGTKGSAKEMGAISCIMLT